MRAGAFKKAPGILGGCAQGKAGEPLGGDRGVRLREEGEGADARGLVGRRCGTEAGNACGRRGLRVRSRPGWSGGAVEWAVRAVGPSRREAGGAGPSYAGPRDATGPRIGKNRAGFFFGEGFGLGLVFLFYSISFLFSIPNSNKV